MKEAFLSVTAVLMLGCGGCAWPAATYIDGTAAVVQPGSQQAASSPAPGRGTTARLIVVKYWSIQELFNSDRKKFEFVGAQAANHADFRVSFPVRFYPAIWTPALGTQHLLPDAGLIVFAEGHWPSHVIPNNGRRCCEAPTTGKRHWHVALQQMDQAPACRPPAKGWDRDEFPPLTLDQLDSVLRWNWSLTKADRQMCRRQLEQLLGYWRDRPSPPPR